MTATAYTAHEIFADKANDYLDKHNVYELFGSILKDLVITRPKDPLSHMITLLERPMEVLRVVVFGAPGSGREDMIRRIAAEFGVIQIEIEKLMQSEINNKTSLGAKVKDCRDNNLVISDELMTTIVRARLSKSDCLNKGWLLDGYPATSSQLTSLQLAGILSNKVLILDEPMEASKAKALSSGLYSDLSIDDFEKLYEEYERNIRQVLPLYPVQTKRFVDASQDDLVLWANVSAFCALSPPSLAPRRPMRVCMLGPQGTGKSTKCTKMAHTYGVIHLSAGGLLRAEMAKNQDLADQVAMYIETGAYVPDDVVSEIVIRRLLQSDCRKHGWLLDGFPRTAAQAKALEAANLMPNRVIFLEISADASIDRCSNRRIDPDTLDIYDLRSDTPPPPAVAQRLITQPKDRASTLSTSVTSYYNNVEDLKALYKHKRIDGLRASDVVYDEIQNFYLASLGATKFGKD